LRLVAIESTNNAQFVAIGDINVFVTDSIPARVANGGRWGLTLDFPLVPVGVFVNPISGNVVTFSSWRHNDFDKDSNNKTTFTATWDRRNEKITDKQIENTHHDMFCPGMSFDQNGRMIITGGSTAYETSIYDSAKNEWSEGGQLAIERGYQGQSFVPNGKTFLIGGSWAGQGKGNKNGEIYDPATKKWKELTGCPAKRIEMSSDPEGEGRWDYHVWMFGWKKDSIFHAGPAKTMHWITTSDNGAIKDAGTREADGLADGDAVCGITSMYDAENGLILTAGGAPQYQYWKGGPEKKTPQGQPATNNAFIIKLGDPNTNVTVKKAGQMKFKRAFANAVTLPNGETFVVGGQERGEPFYEETWQAVPEIYSPETRTWREAAQHSTPRVYHSFALLLPDATVLVGGGGLHREPTNHFDAQIYYPPYLLKSDGESAATRPKINSAATSVKVGETLTITTDIAVDGASLVRFSGATHSLNNDQRRIKLNPVKVNAVDLKYTVNIPESTGVALPGYWMLFVIANGVPSVSQSVQIRIA
jgi:galactose oxidase